MTIQWVLRLNFHPYINSARVSCLLLPAYGIGFGCIAVNDLKVYYSFLLNTLFRAGGHWTMFISLMCFRLMSNDW